MDNTSNIDTKISSTLIKKKGWSQGGLVQKIEVSHEITVKYERNVSLLSIEMIVKIAQIFSIRVDLLIAASESASLNKETWNAFTTPTTEFQDTIDVR